MAKEKPNKSQAIRDAMTENPKATPAEIVEIVKGKGVEVAVGLVYQVKQQQGKKGKKAARGTHNPNNQAKASPNNQAKAVVASGNGKLGFGQAISTVRKAADAVGGIDNLLEIANALKG